MKTIEIDNDVYRFIQSKAIPFEDKTPNDTIRRLFGLDVLEITKVMPDDAQPNQLSAAQHIERLIAEVADSRVKAPKADLAELIRQGLLTHGQIVTLVDYSGKRYEGETAQVHGSQLLYDGRRYSMSKLANQLLKKHGYKSDSVRGPAHWVTSSGATIVELWSRCLNQVDYSR